MANTSVLDGGESDVYLQVENYSWYGDEDFQGGLSAILGPNPEAEQAETLILQARCFFYSRQACCLSTFISTR